MEYKNIQLSDELLKKLDAKKLSDDETYEDIIWGFLENTMELSDDTIVDIERARAEIKAGNYVTEEEMKAELGL